MFCGSQTDFCILLNKFTVLEKKIKSLQKSVKALLEVIDNNQAEVKRILQEGNRNIQPGMREKDYCSIRL